MMSCSSYSKHFIRKFLSRRYRSCEDFEIDDPVGKFCFKYCVDRKFFGDECKKWKWDIKDYCKRDDFLQFRSGGFVMEVEK